MSVPNLTFVLAGGILPAIAYLDANGTAQTLNWRFPPQNVDPVAPVPVRADAVAGDGTMWTLSMYTEAYVQMQATAFIGDDLYAWLAFLQAAGDGQVVNFYPDKTKGTYYRVRLMIGRSSGASNSNVPTGDATMKRVGPGRFKAQLVFRFETPADAASLFAGLNPTA